MPNFNATFLNQNLENQIAIQPDCVHADAENAVICTLGTTVLSCATIPVLYWLLCMII